MTKNEFCYAPQDSVDEVNGLFWEIDPDAPAESIDSNPHIPLYDPQPDIPSAAAQSDASSSNSEQFAADVIEADHDDLPAPPEPIIAYVDPEVVGQAHSEFLTNKEYERYLRDHPNAVLTCTTGFMTKPPEGGGRPAHAYRYFINCMIQPNDVRNALSGPEGEQWQTAMRNEYQSLIQSGTWTLVPRPGGVKPVQCRWILKKKYDDSEMVYKARLVAKGFSLRQGVDYFDTFFPSHPNIIRPSPFIFRYHSTSPCTSHRCQDRFLE